MANSFGLASKKVTQVTLTGAVGCLIGAIVGELVLLFLPAATTDAIPQVDVMFVADVTGSMQDEIDGIRDGIREFADTLGRAAVEGEDAKKQLDVQVGLVAFRDNLADERSQVLKFDGQPLTAQYDDFRRQVARLLADGGGDEAESSLDALGEAAALTFRPEATKVLLLITDAPPQVPDVSVESLEELEGILKEHKISQLHLVVPERFRSDYDSLQKVIPGDFFPLERDGSQDFAKVLPEMGERIAEKTLQGISGLKSYAADDFMRLVVVYGLWTACLAVGISLSLIAGQNYYLGRKLLSKQEAILGAAGGALVGTLAGAAGQMLYSVASLGGVGRIIAWAMLGALVGGGMAFFVPNLNARQSLKFGALGGAAGAVGFLIASLILGEILGRFLGAAILGFFIALVVAIVEMVYRQAWLEVKYGEKEVKFVTLGAQPVRVGSDGQRCTVYAPEARPLAYEYRFENSEVKITDFAKEQTTTVQPGDQRTMGRVTVTVCTGNDASKVATVSPVAPPPPPPKPKAPETQKRAPSGAAPAPSPPGPPAAVAAGSGEPTPRREPVPAAGRGTGSLLPPPPPPPPRKKAP